METNKSVDDILAHHGILGMRWGVRRKEGPGGTVSETSAASRSKASRLKEKAEASTDYSKSRELKTKAAKTLTNAEIKALNERLQLERTLSQLRPDTLNKGMDRAKTVLAIGTTMASIYAVSQTPLGTAIKNAISKVKD